MNEAVIACPGCQSPLAITPELLGRTIACPACQTHISLAASGTVAPQQNSALPQIQAAAPVKQKVRGVSPFILATWGIVAIMVLAAGLLIAMRLGGSGAQTASNARSRRGTDLPIAAQPHSSAVPATLPEDKMPAVPAPAVPSSPETTSPLPQSHEPKPSQQRPSRNESATSSQPPSSPAVSSSPVPTSSPHSSTLPPRIGGLPAILHASPPPVGPLAGLEAAWKLPTLLSTQEERLALLASPPREPLLLTITSGAADLPGTAAIFAEPEADGAEWNVQYVAALDAQAQKTPLGSIAMQGRELRFSWANPLPEAALARQLANCLVEVRHASETHVAQLRQPAALGACQLNLDENVQTVELDLSNPPKLDLLRLEIRELVNFPSGARLRNDLRTLEVGKRTFIEFADLPGAETSVQLTKLGAGLVLRLESEFKENAASKYDLSLSRLEGLEEGMKKALAGAERELPAEQARLLGLQSQLSTAASTRATSLPEQAALQRAVSSLQGQVKRAANKVGSLQKQIAESQARLAAVPNIRSFLESLHERAELRYEIVAECGDRDLVLVDGTGSAAGAE
jgi:hypothetical protein